MASDLDIHVNGISLRVPEGCTVAAAIAIAGFVTTRHSVHNEGRGPLCGMGICFECRVTINHAAHRLGCQVQCEQGMSITTG